jgi:DNA-binding IclR family transcriptional regulator
VVAKALKAPLRRYTDKTIVDPTLLTRHLKKVRDQGFAVCVDELDPGVLSYACPIMVAGAGVLYSVGVVGLSRRIATFKERDVIAALSEVAQHIAARLVAEMKVFEAA